MEKKSYKANVSMQAVNLYANLKGLSHDIDFDDVNEN
jgi:hypothetical protein